MSTPTAEPRIDRILSTHSWLVPGQVRALLVFRYRNLIESKASPGEFQTLLEEYTSELIGLDTDQLKDRLSVVEEAFDVPLSEFN
jgi:hypothetical protein